MGIRVPRRFLAFILLSSTRIEKSQQMKPYFIVFGFACLLFSSSAVADFPHRRDTNVQHRQISRSDVVRNILRRADAPPPQMSTTPAGSCSETLGPAACEAAGGTSIDFCTTVCCCPGKTLRNRSSMILILHSYKRQHCRRCGPKVATSRMLSERQRLFPKVYREVIPLCSSSLLYSGSAYCCAQTVTDNVCPPNSKRMAKRADYEAILDDMTRAGESYMSQGWNRRKTLLSPDLVAEYYRTNGKFSYQGKECKPYNITPSGNTYTHTSTLRL